MPIKPSKPSRLKIASGFLPLTMGNAGGTRAHPQRRSPLHDSTVRRSTVDRGAKVAKAKKRMY